jgi:Pyocin large subunit
VAHHSPELRLRRTRICKNQSVSQTARETGLSEGTLHKWKKQARAKGIPVLGGEQKAENWSTQDKFLIVMETGVTVPLTEIEMAEYCRSRGSSYCGSC